MNLTHTELATILSCSAANVAAYWPPTETCLESLSLGSARTKIAALATIRIETGIFKPLIERGSHEYFIANYWDNLKVRGWLGNICPDDAWMYCGRGLIQTTGRANYERGGKALGIDLLSDPDKALEPNTAAALFALYFHDHHVNLAADAGDWLKVRKQVNGGTNGLREFMLYVARLLRAASFPSMADQVSAGGA